jgi:hypothetical protein
MYGFEEELTIVDSELLEKAGGHSKGIDEFFAALNVRRDDPYSLVASHILPRHEGQSWKTSEHKALLGHLRYIKDKFDRYLLGAVKAGKSPENAVSGIRDGMWLGTKDKADGSWKCSRAENLYLSKE